MNVKEEKVKLINSRVIHLLQNVPVHLNLNIPLADSEGRQGGGSCPPGCPKVRKNAVNVPSWMPLWSIKHDEVPSPLPMINRIFIEITIWTTAIFKSQWVQYMLKEKCVCQNTILFKFGVTAKSSWPTHCVLWT